MNFGRRERQEFIDYILEQQLANRSDVYPVDVQWVRTFAEASYDRAYTPEGVVRQLQAMLGDLGSSFADAARLTMPWCASTGWMTSTSTRRARWSWRAASRMPSCTCIPA